MELRQRKKNRLQGYNYGRPGYYFITVCIEGHAEMLGEVVRECRGAHCAPAYVRLSDIGQVVENAILQIPKYHKEVCVDKYVIMPNHIHMILALVRDSGRTMCAPNTPFIHSRNPAWNERSGYKVGRFSHLAKELPRPYHSQRGGLSADMGIHRHKSGQMAGRLLLRGR